MRDSICHLSVCLSLSLSVCLSLKCIKRHQMCQTSCRQWETFALLNLQDVWVLAVIYNHIFEPWLMILVNWLNSASVQKCFSLGPPPPPLLSSTWGCWEWRESALQLPVQRWTLVPRSVVTLKGANIAWWSHSWALISVLAGISSD